MKSILLVLVCFAFLNPISGQLETYDISTFARLDLKRKTSRLNLNLNLSADKEIARDQFDFSSIGGGSIINTWFVNTKDQQTFGYFSGSLSMNIKGESSNGRESFRFFAPRIISSSSTRKFLNEALFIESGWDLTANYNFQKIGFTNGDDETFRSLGSSLVIPLNLGKGRVEVVTDAWHAHTILEILKEENLLEQELDHSSISNFAHEVASIKNARFTDPRHYRINEFERLMEYLIEAQYVDPTDYRLFAHVFDAWEFERFVTRRHGRYYSFGLNTGLDYSLQSNVDFQSNLIEPSLRLTGKFENFNSKSKDWQIDQSLSAEWGPYWTIRSRDGVSELNEKRYFASLRASSSIGFYPNQRTNFVVSSSINDDVEYTEFGNNHFLFIDIRPVITYYVSPKFTFVIEGLFLWGDRIDRTSNIESENQLVFKTFYQFY